MAKQNTRAIQLVNTVEYQHLRNEPRAHNRRRKPRPHRHDAHNRANQNAPRPWN
jgi:hypothetical protein